MTLDHPKDKEPGSAAGVGLHLHLLFTTASPDTPSTISLGSQDELPLDGQISFLLKAEIPNRFSRSERIEVATADESFTTLLSMTDGSLMLRDSESALAVFDPHKAFGPSAFGPLQFRPVGSRWHKRGLAVTGDAGARPRTERNSLPGEP